MINIRPFISLTNCSDSTIKLSAFVESWRNDEFVGLIDKAPEFSDSDRSDIFTEREYFIITGVGCQSAIQEIQSGPAVLTENGIPFAQQHLFELKRQHLFSVFRSYRPAFLSKTMMQ